MSRRKIRFFVSRPAVGGQQSCVRDGPGPVARDRADKIVGKVRGGTVSAVLRYADAVRPITVTEMVGLTQGQSEVFVSREQSTRGQESARQQRSRYARPILASSVTKSLGTTPKIVDG